MIPTMQIVDESTSGKAPLKQLATEVAPECSLTTREMTKLHRCALGSVDLLQTRSYQNKTRFAIRILPCHYLLRSILQDHGNDFQFREDALMFLSNILTLLMVYWLSGKIRGKIRGERA